MRTSFSAWQTGKINRTSFGIDRRPTSTQWNDLMQGPSFQEFREHIRKLANFLEPLK